jgi:hypothetical protein
MKPSSTTPRGSFEHWLEWYEPEGSRSELSACWDAAQIACTPPSETAPLTPEDRKTISTAALHLATWATSGNKEPYANTFDVARRLEAIIARTDSGEGLVGALRLYQAKAANPPDIRKGDIVDLESVLPDFLANSLEYAALRWLRDQGYVVDGSDGLPYRAHGYIAKYILLIPYVGHVGLWLSDLVLYYCGDHNAHVIARGESLRRQG